MNQTKPSKAASLGDDSNRSVENSTVDTKPGDKKRKHNWRLNMLSVPRVLTPKYKEPEYILNTGVAPEALKAQCPERVEQLALSGMRYLQVNKKIFMPMKGEKYGKLMDNYIEKSWNSIYNYYRKSLHDLRKKKSEQDKKRKLHKMQKGKGKVGKKASKSSEKSKETLLKEREEWCKSRSTPKPLVKPTPIDRGPIVDLDAIKARQDEMAIPKRLYKRPSQDSNYKDILKVKPSALTYEPSPRMTTLAQPTAHRLLKEEVILPGAVKPSALTYKISERVTLLAVPKQTSAARESDLNEDAFTISPSALKYVATPRMAELARPKEYTK